MLKICGMLLIETLKSKIPDFLNSNTCFCLRLYGTRGSKGIDGRSSGEDDFFLFGLVFVVKQILDRGRLSKRKSLVLRRPLLVAF